MPPSIRSNSGWKPCSADRLAWGRGRWRAPGSRRARISAPDAPGGGLARAALEVDDGDHLQVIAGAAGRAGRCPGSWCPVPAAPAAPEGRRANNSAGRRRGSRARGLAFQMQLPEMGVLDARGLGRLARGEKRRSFFLALGGKSWAAVRLKPLGELLSAWLPTRSMRSRVATPLRGAGSGRVCCGLCHPCLASGAAGPFVAASRRFFCLALLCAWTAGFGQDLSGSPRKEGRRRFGRIFCRGAVPDLASGPLPGAAVAGPSRKPRGCDTEVSGEQMARPTPISGRGPTVEICPAFGAAALLLGTATYAQDLSPAAANGSPMARPPSRRAWRFQPVTGTAKNVIPVRCRWQGVDTNYAIRLYSGQQAGGTGDDYVQPHERCPMAR